MPDTPVREVALFGGSFDPPHCAHVMVASWILACTPCRELWVIPVFEHAFGKIAAPFRTRVAMCRAAFACFGRRVRVLDVEARLPHPSFTVQTLRHLASAQPDARFTLVVGSDIPAETARWRDFDAVRRLARLLVVGRDGAADAPGPRFPAVSSTRIRQDLAAGLSVDDRVPRDVLAVVRREGLYGTR
jgi:nicotinate-nucleotide adenylyltransferase